MHRSRKDPTSPNLATTDLDFTTANGSGVSTTYHRVASIRDFHDVLCDQRQDNRKSQNQEKGKRKVSHIDHLRNGEKKGGYQPWIGTDAWKEKQRPGDRPAPSAAQYRQLKVPGQG